MPLELKNVDYETAVDVIDDFVSDDDLSWALEESKRMFRGEKQGISKKANPMEGFNKYITDQFGDKYASDLTFWGKFGVNWHEEDISPHGDIHSDGSYGKTMLLYLSDGPKDSEKAGVGFYRHLKTGLLNNPYSPFSNEAGKIKFDQIIQDGHDSSLWEPTLSIPYRKGRAVLFDSNLFHARLDVFGDCSENGRHFQIYCFDVIPN